MRSEIGTGILHEEPTFSCQKTLGREFQDVGFLGDEEITAKAEALFSPEVATAQQNSEQLLNWIAGWQGAEVGRLQRLQDLDGAIGTVMDTNGGPNWNTLTLLAEVESSRPSVYAHFKILDVFEGHPDFLTPQIREHIEGLVADPNPESQVVLHKLCDFLTGMAVTSQFQQPLENEEAAARQEMLLDNIAKFARSQEQATANYLLASHWQDVAETVSGRFSVKPDKISGVPGESSDYVIMTYNEFALLQSYYNSVLAGKEHFSPEQPLIPLAQGYLGQYKRGQLQEVLPEDYSETKKAYQADKDLVRQNADEDNYIYRQLNNGSYEYPSFTLSNFLRRVEKQGRQFYFNVINDDLDDPRHPNTKRLNPQTLHPETLAEILGHNYRLLHQNVKPNHPAEAISAQEYLKRIFPAGKHTAAEAYLYQDMVSLQRRKRIEQDMGENLSNIPPYGQAQLLKFLSSRNKEEFSRLIAVSDRWGQRDQNPARQDFLLSFLACNEAPENAHIILNLAEQLPPETSAAVFAKYADIAASSERVNEYLERKFGHAEVEDEGVQAMVRDIFSKANLLLRHMAKEATMTQDVERLTQQLESFRAEVALYISVVGELRKERKISLQEEIEKYTVTRKSGELTPTEEEEMVKIFAFGRAEVFPEELQAQSLAEFREKLKKGGHTFYLYKPEDKIVAFLHTDPVEDIDGTIKDDAIYVGSLNLSPEGRNGALGVVFAQHFLEKYAADFDIYADVMEFNTRALNFYTKFLGFKQRDDEPFSVIVGDNGESFKNINIVREKRPEARAMAA